MRRSCRFASVCILLISPIAFLGQSGDKSLEEPSSAVQLDPEAAKKLVRAQFGSGYTLSTPLDPMIGDFNGDGIPDLVLVAHASNPLVNSVGFNYKVIDPYYAFYGFGDPKVTMNFDASDPRNRGLVLLIIHGAANDAWKAPTPKAKFVIINVPFVKVSLSKTLLHKKPISAIAAQEVDTNSSVIFWTGKSYQYHPFGGAME
ncbi:MAG TPA: hypothetical protein VFA76_02990 [Terriglobales bacterium]|nr:hypothetical protein [Terriglobales bacterium]